MLPDPGVSSTHAQLTHEDGQVVLTDLQSRNQCYVNNQRVDRTALRHADVVVLGVTRLYVQLQ